MASASHVLVMYIWYIHTVLVMYIWYIHTILVITFLICPELPIITNIVNDVHKKKFFYNPSIVYLTETCSKNQCNKFILL